jgi:DNA-binding HxlR family transcriptional regulator
MMGKRRYHQYCMLANALDLLGERWTLLVVRDLLLGPKRYKDLLQGLPGIGTNVLATRLKELEHANIVHRRVLPPPAGSTVYELTEYGQELDGILMALANWGKKSQGSRQPDQILKPITLVLGLRERFNAEAARHVEVTYELRFDEYEIYTLRISNGSLEARYGSTTRPDLVITVDVETFLQLRIGRRFPQEALASGAVHLDGNADFFLLFFELFDAGM